MTDEHPMPTDNQPDWHGEKGKRKREQTIRSASIRAFVISSSVGFLIFVISAWIVLQHRFDATPPKGLPATQYFNDINADLTAIAADAARSTMTAQPIQSDRIFAGDFVTQPGTPTLPAPQAQIGPLAGYHFTGMQFGPDGNLYAAHTRGLGITDCAADEAYWVIDSHSMQTVRKITYASLVSPKRIAFDSQDNAYIIAADCQRRAEALFKFSASGEWIDIFPLPDGERADDIAISSDNQILLAISYTQAESSPQPHLLEIHTNSGNGRFTTADAAQIGNEVGGRYLSLKMVPLPTSHADYLYMAWLNSDRGEELQSLILNAQSDFAAMNPANLQISTLVAPGDFLIDNLANAGQTVYGLREDRRFGVVCYDPVANNVLTSIPISDSGSFAIDPHTHQWFLAGHNYPNTLADD